MPSPPRSQPGSGELNAFLRKPSGMRTSVPADGLGGCGSGSLERIQSPRPGGVQSIGNEAAFHSGLENVRDELSPW